MKNSKFTIIILTLLFFSGLAVLVYEVTWSRKLDLVFGTTNYATSTILAINTNKSIYTPNETVYLQMAVLRDDGYTICDANLKLEITAPNGKRISVDTQKSEECGPDNIIDVPDYFAYYQVGENGIYEMKLTNLDNGYEIIDFFEVRESVPFDVERIGPTRIYPPANYEMKFVIKANQDFTGQIIERIPKIFEIIESGPLSAQIKEGIEVKEIIWDVNWKAGKEYELKYQFNAPNVSPHLYLLGPLKLIEGGSLSIELNEGSDELSEIVFFEARQWQIAADNSDVKSPSTIANDTAVGTVDWGTPGNVTSSDDNYATAVLAKGEISHYLKATNFGFNVSGDIDGIKVEIEKKTDETAFTADNSVMIVKDGSVAGTEKASADAWLLTDTYKTYGNETDTWGVSWSAADINSSNFGVAFSAKNTKSGKPATLNADVDHIRITVYYTPTPTTLTQTSYRWQNDDGDATGNPTTGGNVNTSTNSAVADTTLEMEKGERATWRAQIENSGIATTTSFRLQWATTTDVCNNSLDWTDVGESTEIAWSDGLAGTSGESITSVECAANANTWTNGKWFEATSTTSPFELDVSKYTEFGFMIETSNATVDTDYCLQLINDTASSTLDGYTSYGQLSIVPSTIKKYSKDAVSVVSDLDYIDDLTYYLDSEGYDDVATDDGNSDAITSAAATYPVFLFTKQHTNNTDNINVLWNGSTTVNCGTNTVYLQIYNSMIMQWEAIASSTTCTAGVDFSLQEIIATDPGNYYDDDNWNFVRVYQASGTQTLRTDYIGIVSQTKIEESHYRWRNDDGSEGVIWFDSDWSYRITVPVQNTTSILTDYQVKVDVGYDTDIGVDVDCQGYCQSDFDDVRFTTADGETPLDYWRESYTASANSTFWVKVPSLLANSDTTIYMYYGNGSVSDGSDGDATFEMYDHFLGSSLDSSKWVECDNGAQSVQSSYMELRATVTGGERGLIFTTSTYGAFSNGGYALKQRASRNKAEGMYGVAFTGFRAITGCAQENYAFAFFYGNVSPNSNVETANQIGSEATTITIASDNDWHIYETIWEPNQVRYYFDEILKDTDTAYVPTSTTRVYFLEGAGTDAEDRRTYIDWTFVRKFVSPEPSIGTQGSEETSGGATWMAAEDTFLSLTSTQQSNNIRVRFSLKNSGYSADSYNYRLQYAALGGSPDCTSLAENDFSDVPVAAGGVVQMTTSGNFIDQDPTTNFEGSLTDPGDGWTWIDGKIVEDPSNETDAITLDEYRFTELEYNFKFAVGAPDGTIYCFRVAEGDIGGAISLASYSQIAKISTKGDVTVSTIGSQIASLDISSTNSYVGGGFIINEQTDSRNVTGITITEQGTVDAQNDLENIKLFYDLDTSAPYDCADEQYDAGTDEQFGSATIFNGANGIANFTETVGISTTSPLCIYVVLDVKKSASVGETLEIQITDPSTEVAVDTGTVGPPSAVPISGTTELAGLEQVHYRWRGDTGPEVFADWLYKKSLDIQNSGTALTDFQVRVDVGYNTTSGVDVSCESNCKTDFADIRFIDNNNNVLDYWQEKYTASASSTFWVKVPSLLTNSTTTIYVYYGNSNASTTSNGANTFIFFDDFEDGDYDDEWTAQSGYWHEGSGVLKTWNPPAHPGGRFIYLKNRTSSNSSPEVHEFKIQWESGQTSTHLAGMMWHWNPPDPQTDLYRIFNSNPSELLYIRYVDTELGDSPISYTGTYDEWYNFLLKIKGGGDYYFKIQKFDETNVTSTDFSDASGSSGYVGLGGGGGGFITAFYDDYRIRKYASPEPSVVTTGSETTGGTGWLAAEDTATTTAKNTNIRVRFSLKNTGTAAQDYYYSLQYSLLGGAGNCISVDEDNFSDVPTTAGSAVIMTTSSWFVGCPEVSQASTTHQLSDISGLTFTPSNMVEYDCNQTASTTLNTNYYTEPEFNFQFTDDAADDTAYCFRLAKGENGTATSTDSYTQVAKITTDAGGGYLFFSVDSSSQIFPSLISGSLVATSSILTVRTDNSSGFYIWAESVDRTSSNSTMDDDANADNNVPDKTEWIASIATTTPGNATASTTEPQTLQFRVRQAGTDEANYASFWWGTDDSTTNALFGGFTSSTASTIHKKIIIRSTPAIVNTTSYILYNLDVPSDQELGNYSGSITYTVIANL